MRRPYFLGLLVLLVGVLVGGIWWLTTRSGTPEPEKRKPRARRSDVKVKGGVILVYEVNPLTGGKDTGPKTDIDRLARQLEDRLDPDGTRHLTVWPAGKSRVEIVLTADRGFHPERAWRDWKALLAKVRSAWAGQLGDDRDVFAVGVGEVGALADRIRERLEETKWPSLLSRSASWEKLVHLALDWQPQKDRERKEKEFRQPSWRGQYPKLIGQVKQYRTAVKDLQDTARSLAWAETLARLEKPFPRAGKLDPKRFGPRRRQELLAALKAKGLDAEAAARFLNKTYGPSDEAIAASIRKQYQPGASWEILTRALKHIRGLGTRAGKLEFLILANNVDDKEHVQGANGVADAEQYLKDQGKGRLDDYARRGEAPPTPDQYYVIKTAKGLTGRVRYRWLEVGPPYRRQLGLSNDQAGSVAWTRAALTRAENADSLVVGIPDQRGGEANGQIYLCSRECRDENLTEEQRQGKKYEYFVLARTPEIDEEGEFVPQGRPKDLTGAYLTSVRRSRDKYLKPSLAFELNATGAALFRDLSRKNVPDEGRGPPFYRHLAIVLDGQVMVAPTINTVIESRAEISGTFTIEEMDRLVNLLRSRALPATLKAEPVKIIPVQPRPRGEPGVRQPQ